MRVSGTLVGSPPACTRSANPRKLPVSNRTDPEKALAEERSLRAIDSGLIGALHIERVGVWDVRLVEHPRHTLFQTSTVDALLSGNYEGDVSFAELEAYGDFGLGTFHALDGEMIALNGAFYQGKADALMMSTSG